eukprot:3286991-Prymnesium_polylepis.1
MARLGDDTQPPTLLATADITLETLAVPSGHFFGHNTEADLRINENAAYTIEITLSGDSWIENITSPEGATGVGLDIVDGIQSAQSEASGCARRVRNRLASRACRSLR